MKAEAASTAAWPMQRIPVLCEMKSIAHTQTEPWTGLYDALSGTAVATLVRMTMDLRVLQCGNCEELKLGVHATALGLAALCGAYNAAAWLSRREQHLAINTVLYAALIAFEQRHVAHHIAELRRLDLATRSLSTVGLVPADPQPPAAIAA